MAVFPVNDEQSYNVALARIEELWECPEGSPEQAELDALVILVEAYEEKVHPVPLPTPAEAIQFALEQMGLKQKDIVGPDKLGSSSRVSEIVRGKRNLSGSQIRAANRLLHISADILVRENVLVAM